VAVGYLIEMNKTSIENVLATISRVVLGHHYLMVCAKNDLFSLKLICFESAKRRRMRLYLSLSSEYGLKLLETEREKSLKSMRFESWSPTDDPTPRTCFRAAKRQGPEAVFGGKKTGAPKKAHNRGSSGTAVPTYKYTVI